MTIIFPFMKGREKRIAVGQFFYLARDLFQSLGMGEKHKVNGWVTSHKVIEKSFDVLSTKLALLVKLNQKISDHLIV